MNNNNKEDDTRTIEIVVYVLGLICVVAISIYVLMNYEEGDIGKLVANGTGSVVWAVGGLYKIFRKDSGDK